MTATSLAADRSQSLAGNEHVPVSRWTGVVLASASVLVTMIIALARLGVEPRFYYADDTQLGSIGIWHELGTMALGGGLRILDPHAWQGGNYFAEGQWGLLNPLVWLIGIGSLATDQVLVYVTIVKVLVLGAFALGVYLLARSFGASSWWAAAAGIMAPAAGFTTYMDAPSWVSGLFNITAFAYVWWGLRRLELGRSPLPYLVATYLLITFGYVFGVIMLVALLVVTLAVALLQRRWRWAAQVGAASLFGALLTLTIYLPGILTAPVTDRGTTAILQAWFLSADLTDLAGLASPTASMSVGAWWGPATHAPMMYLSWALPLIVLAWPGLRAARRQLLVPLLFAAVAAFLILGPSHVGPLRWPVRFLPYLAVAAAVVWAVALTRAYPASASTKRLWWMLGVTLGLAWLAWTQSPTALLLVATTVVILCAQVVLYLIAVVRKPALGESARSTVAASVVVLATVAMLVPQLYEYRSTPLGTFAVPNETGPMTAILDDGVDDGLVIGDAYAGIFEPATFEERLVANLWYYSPTSVSNVYTVLPYTAFAEDLCIDLRGATCPEAAATLSEVDDTTGMTVSELLGVNTVVAIRSSYPDGPPDLGAGWTRAPGGATVWTYVRDRQVGAAGGLAWTGGGTSATVLSQTNESVRLRIDEVGDDTRLVFRRLDYPGYSVQGASVTEPLRGYLLTVDVAGASRGDEVTVTFRPPGWGLELAALALVLAGLVAWPVAHEVRRRRTAHADGGRIRLG